MRGVLASPLGLLIGLSLGSVGGGGSILAVPALVYGAGESPRAATSTSLLVVGAAALLGIGSHWQAGRIRLGPGLLFGAVGVGGSVIGTALNRHADPDVLLLAFSGVMGLAAIAMWRRDRRCAAGTEPWTHPPDEPPTPSGGDAVSTIALTRPATALTSQTIPKVVLAGSAVGLMTGFFGVGGGFVIVPALVLILGFSMPDAVGTSLVVIAINSAVALALRAGSSTIEWADAVPFLVLAVIGTVLGKRIADRVAATSLTMGFVALLLAVAVYTATSSALALA